MIECYCCERRFGIGLLLDPCACNPSFCTECILCSQHCQCEGRQTSLVVNEEFVQDAETKPEITIDPEDFFPDADMPTVVPG